MNKEVGAGVLEHLWALKIHCLIIKELGLWGKGFGFGSERLQEAVKGTFSSSGASLQTKALTLDVRALCPLSMNLDE